VQEVNMGQIMHYMILQGMNTDESQRIHP